MKRVVLTESEKKSLLNMHISKGYKTIMEQSEEILNTTHDKVWDYKKVGDEYYTKRKVSDKWIKASGTALDAIKNKVKFEPTQQQDKTEQQPTQQQDKTEQQPTQQQDNTEQQPTQQQDNTEQQPTQQQDNTKPTKRISCDTIIDAIAFKGTKTPGLGGGADVSLLTPEKWFEYFGINLEETKNNGVISAIKQLKKDTEQGIKKGYVFKDLKLPINIKSKYYGLKEDGCCVYISKGSIYNYNPNLNKDDDIKAKAESKIRILIRYEDIKKVEC